jgi:threonine/homoserine efflux transporter RhtA
VIQFLCISCHMAWLGIIVCSWSYDDDAEINPYGLCAWLTVSCVVAAYFTIDPGFAARVGGSYDHGYTGIYFAMTEVLIALEVYREAGSKEALTLNRVVANLAGIALAILLSSIPPCIRGGDPQHEIECLSSLKDAFVSVADSSQ